LRKKTKQNKKHQIKQQQHDISWLLPLDGLRALFGANELFHWVPKSIFEFILSVCIDSDTQVDIMNFLGVKFSLNFKHF